MCKACDTDRTVKDLETGEKFEYENIGYMKISLPYPVENRRPVSSRDCICLTGKNKGYLYYLPEDGKVNHPTRVF